MYSIGKQYIYDKTPPGCAVPIQGIMTNHRTSISSSYSTLSCRLMQVLALVLFLVWPATAPAGTTVSFLPIEEAKFLVKAEDLADVAKLVATIEYDTTYLARPEATVSGGRLLEAAGIETSPGRLRLEMIPDPGSTQIEACVFFQKLGDYPAVINFVTAEIIDHAGQELTAPVAMLPALNAPIPPVAEETTISPAPAAQDAPPPEDQTAPISPDADPETK